MKQWLAPAGIALALAGCTVAPPRPAVPAAQAEAAQQAREAAVRAQADWHLDGRIAVANGRDGGSGRIEWTQQGSRYRIAVSAPVTRQSWRLTGDAAAARIEGLPGGPRESEDPAALLHETTGWPVPVEALAWWVRGARAPGEPAVIEFGPDGLPARIAQDGWTIAYVWPDGAAAPEFPARIEARRDPVRVRLAIDAARLGSAADTASAP